MLTEQSVSSVSYSDWSVRSAASRGSANVIGMTLVSTQIGVEFIPRRRTSSRTSGAGGIPKRTSSSMVADRWALSSTAAVALSLRMRELHLGEPEASRSSPTNVAEGPSSRHEIFFEGRHVLK